MNKQTKLMTNSMILFFATSLIGCGQGLQSSGVQAGANSAASVPTQTDISAELNKASQANSEAAAAIVEANAALKSIQNADGSINVSLFKKSGSAVNTTGLLAPVIDKLRTAFDKVFAKVELVKGKFNEARAALATAAAKLDKNDPAQAALLAQITKQMAAVDSMEAKFKTSLSSLAGKLDLAVAGLEKIISGVTNFIPGFGWLANMGLDYLVMGDIRDFVAEIKLRLISI